jgi:DNA-binding XRE family transcriptional regulator/predicted RNase H-like HicB family nuclease
MYYTAKISREGKHWLAEFPDCPGCQTFASSKAKLAAMAKDALEGWLAAHLKYGRVPPEPSSRLGGNAMNVYVDPSLAMAVQIRQHRARAGLSQDALAERAGVTQQQIAKLERPKSNPQFRTVQKVAQALKLRLDADLRCA